MTTMFLAIAIIVTVVGVALLAWALIRRGRQAANGFWVGGDERNYAPWIIAGSGVLVLGLLMIVINYFANLVSGAMNGPH